MLEETNGYKVTENLEETARYNFDTQIFAISRLAYNLIFQVINYLM